MSTIIKQEAAPYLEAFQSRESDAAEPDWLRDRRAAALERFASLGFPTRRDEPWRFTNLAPLAREAYPPAPPPKPPKSRLPLEPYLVAGAAHRIVMIDGYVVPELSAIGRLPKGAWLGSTARALAERPDLAEAGYDERDATSAQPFAALNGAFFGDGFVLALAAGAVLEELVEVIHVASTVGRSLHPRTAVIAGAGSRATLVETFCGAGAWTNGVLRIELGADASLDHVRIQDEALDAIHFGVTRARLGRGARYESFTLTTGARLSRQDVQVVIEGEGARCGVNGAYLLRGQQEATTATVIDHAAPGGTTREVFKGVLEDRAHGVFLGRIAVRPGADKTDAHQLNRNLLLSPRAAVDTKPELEIFADDVKCSHGATVGDLDEAALFYLCSRGIDETAARRLLIEAFATDAIEATVSVGDLAAHLRRRLGVWLEQSGSA
ncbi:MAG TPA: Fe-S cluster assembly protein SufD [Stellaceae bacterium]|jgi:Fe-S cluster assembly protein SufD|nr:Fe-S cluster assembly protein SufD [Stellaceae bacterium]